LEYDDEDIQSCKPSEFGGTTVEMDGSNAVFNKALDDYIHEQKSRSLVDGVDLPPKGLRRIIVGEADDSGESIAPDFKKEYEIQLAKQTEFEGLISEMKGDHKDIEECQEYLRDTVQKEEWDCESILSTYSTLDNHPSVIKVHSMHI
jgi:protein LTV1